MKRFLFVLVAILMGACQEESRQTSSARITILPSSLSEGPAESIFQSLTWVALYGTDRLIGNVSRIKVFGDTLFILAYDPSHCLYGYSLSTGKLLLDICRQGEGPGEYTSVWDFDYQPEQNQIILLDRTQKKLHYFDLDGQFLHSKDHPSYFYASSFISLPNGNFLFYCQNENPESMKHLVEWDPEEGKVANEYLDIDPVQRHFLNVVNPHNFHVYNGKFYFTKVFDPHLYEVHPGVEVLPRRKIDYGSYSLPEELLYKPYADIREFMTRIRETDYAFNRIRHVENASYIAFHLEWMRSFFFTIYDKKTENYRVLTKLKDVPVCTGKRVTLEDIPDLGPFALTENDELIFALETSEEFFDPNDCQDLIPSEGKTPDLMLLLAKPKIFV